MRLNCLAQSLPCKSPRFMVGQLESIKRAIISAVWLLPSPTPPPSQVTTVAADQSFTIRDLESGEMKMNLERCSLGHLTRRGLYLAFHNPGACVALVSVRVFYQRCPEAVHGLAQFPDTLPRPGRLVEVAGACVPHARMSPGPSGAPRMHCSSDGEWLVPVGWCHCEPGYEEGGEACLGKGTPGGGDNLQGPLGGGGQCPGCQGREGNQGSMSETIKLSECPRAPGTHTWGCFQYRDVGGGGCDFTHKNTE